jgi:hypothetical protein
MSDTARPTKISFAEMRNQAAQGVLVYCSDYRSVAISGDGHRL